MRVCRGQRKGSREGASEGYYAEGVNTSIVKKDTSLGYPLCVMKILMRDIPIVRDRLALSPAMRGALWKFVSTTCFAVISMVACWLQVQKTTMSPSQVAFFQVFIPFMLLLPTRLGSWDTLRQGLLTKAPMWALLRSVTASVAFLGWFCTLRIYPLSLAISFRLIGPLVTFIAALWFLGERTSWQRFLGLLFLLVSVPFLVRQEIWHTHFHHQAPLLQLIALPVVVVLGYVGANLAGKKLMQRVAPGEATFSLLGLNSVFIGLFALWNWHMPAPYEWGWLLLVGLLEWGAQWALARALSLTDLSILAPLSLWRFGISAAFGIALLGEQPSAFFLAGMTLMILATPLVVRRRKSRTS